MKSQGNSLSLFLLCQRCEQDGAAEAVAAANPRSLDVLGSILAPQRGVPALLQPFCPLPLLFSLFNPAAPTKMRFISGLCCLKHTFSGASQS